MVLGSLLLTGEQIRAARALGRIDQAELARRTNLSLETIKRLERIRGPVEANVRTLAAIAEAFGQMGIAFDCSAGGIGVRLTVGGRSAATAQAGGQAEQLWRLIFCSTATEQAARMTAAEWDEIGRTVTAQNNAHDVTGALLFCAGRFLQALEGRKAAVQQIYGAISTNERHANLRVIQYVPIKSRQFADWRLRRDDLAGYAALAGEPALANGFHPELLSPASALGLLAMIADMATSLDEAVHLRT